MRGNVRSPYAGRAKEYAWSACVSLAPRNITPTDIDYCTECAGRFLAFEFKTIGASMATGQRIMLERWLVRLGVGNYVMVCEHPAIDVVSVHADVSSVQLWAFDPRAAGRLPEPTFRNPFEKLPVWKSKDLPGRAFSKIYSAFFKEAEGDNHAMRAACLDVISDAA